MLPAWSKGVVMGGKMPCSFIDCLPGYAIAIANPTGPYEDMLPNAGRFRARMPLSADVLHRDRLPAGTERPARRGALGGRLGWHCGVGGRRFARLLRRRRRP